MSDNEVRVSIGLDLDDNQFVRDINNLTDSIEDIGLGVDISDAEKAIDDLRDYLKSINETLDIDIDGDELKNQIKEVVDSIPDVEMSISADTAELNVLKAELNEIFSQYKAVNNYFQNNPITPVVNSEQVDALYEKLEKLSSKTYQVNVEENVSSGGSSSGGSSSDFSRIMTRAVRDGFKESKSSFASSPTTNIANEMQDYIKSIKDGIGEINKNAGTGIFNEAVSVVLKPARDFITGFSEGISNDLGSQIAKGLRTTFAKQLNMDFQKMGQDAGNALLKAFGIKVKQENKLFNAVAAGGSAAVGSIGTSLKNYAGNKINQQLTSFLDDLIGGLFKGVSNTKQASQQATQQARTVVGLPAGESITNSRTAARPRPIQIPVEEDSPINTTPASINRRERVTIPVDQVAQRVNQNFRTKLENTVNKNAEAAVRTAEQTVISADQAIADVQRTFNNIKKHFERVSKINRNAMEAAAEIGDYDKVAKLFADYKAATEEAKKTVNAVIQQKAKQAGVKTSEFTAVKSDVNRVLGQQFRPIEKRAGEANYKAGQEIERLKPVVGNLIKNVQAGFSQGANTQVYLKLGIQHALSYLTGLRDAFQIKSPSRETEKDGKNIVLGLVKGVVANSGLVTKSFQDIRSNIAETLKPVVSTVSTATNQVVSNPRVQRARIQAGRITDVAGNIVSEAASEIYGEMYAQAPQNVRNTLDTVNKRGLIPTVKSTATNTVNTAVDATRANLGILPNNAYTDLLKAVAQITGTTINAKNAPQLVPSEILGDGSYKVNQNAIKLDKKDYQQVMSASNISELSDDLVNTLLHEIFHAVQYNFGKDTLSQAGSKTANPTLTEIAKVSGNVEASVAPNRNKVSDPKALAGLELGANIFAERYTQLVKQSAISGGKLPKLNDLQTKQLPKEVQEVTLGIGRALYDTIEKTKPVIKAAEKAGLSVDQVRLKANNLVKQYQADAINLASKLDKAENLSPKEIEQAVKEFNNLIGKIESIKTVVKSDISREIRNKALQDQTAKREIAKQHAIENVARRNQTGSQPTKSNPYQVMKEVGLDFGKGFEDGAIASLVLANKRIADLIAKNAKDNKNLNQSQRELSLKYVRAVSQDNEAIASGIRSGTITRSQALETLASMRREANKEARYLGIDKNLVAREGQQAHREVRAVPQLSPRELAAINAERAREARRNNITAEQGTAMANAALARRQRELGVNLSPEQRVAKAQAEIAAKQAREAREQLSQQRLQELEVRKQARIAAEQAQILQRQTSVAAANRAVRGTANTIPLGATPRPDTTPLGDSSLQNKVQVTFTSLLNSLFTNIQRGVLANIERGDQTLGQFFRTVVNEGGKSVLDSFGLKSNNLIGTIISSIFGKGAGNIAMKLLPMLPGLLGLKALNIGDLISNTLLKNGVIKPGIFTDLLKNIVGIDLGKTTSGFSKFATILSTITGVNLPQLPDVSKAVNFFKNIFSGNSVNANATDRRINNNLNNLGLGRNTNSDAAVNDLVSLTTSSILTAILSKMGLKGVGRSVVKGQLQGILNNNINPEIMNVISRMGRGTTNQLLKDYSTGNVQGIVKTIQDFAQSKGIDIKLNTNQLTASVKAVMATLTNLQVDFSKEGFNLGSKLVGGFKDAQKNWANAADDLKYQAKKALDMADLSDIQQNIINRIKRKTIVPQDLFNELFDQIGNIWNKKTKGTEAEGMGGNVLSFVASVLTSLAPITTALAPVVAMLTPILPLATALGGAFMMVRNQIMGVAEAIKTVEPLQRRLNFLGGGLEGGQREMEYARNVASRLNVPVQEGIGAYSQLAIAARGTRLEGEGVRELYEGISGSLSALGITGQDASLVFMAYTQILAKGKLSMEELRQQLGEKFPPAMSVFAKALNVSIPELNSMIRKGSLLSEEVLPKVAKVLKEDFGKSATDSAGSFTIALTKLGNVGFDIAIKLTNAFGGLFAGVTNLAANSLGMFRDSLDALIPIMTSAVIGVTAVLGVGLTTIFSSGWIKVISDAAVKFVLTGASKLLVGLAPFFVGILADVADDWFGAKNSVMENMFAGMSNLIISTVILPVEKAFRNLFGKSLFQTTVDSMSGLKQVTGGIFQEFSKLFKILPSGVVEMTALVLMFQQLQILFNMFLKDQLKGIGTSISSVFNTITKSFANSFKILGELFGSFSLLWDKNFEGRLLRATIAGKAQYGWGSLLQTIGIGIKSLLPLLAEFGLALGIILLARSDFSNQLGTEISQMASGINGAIRTMNEGFSEMAKKVGDVTTEVKNLKNNIPSKGLELNIPYALGMGGKSFKTDDLTKLKNENKELEGGAFWADLAGRTARNVGAFATSPLRWFKLPTGKNERGEMQLTDWGMKFSREMRPVEQKNVQKAYDELYQLLGNDIQATETIIQGTEKELTLGQTQMLDNIRDIKNNEKELMKFLSQNNLSSDTIANFITGDVNKAASELAVVQEQIDQLTAKKAQLAAGNAPSSEINEINEQLTVLEQKNKEILEPLNTTGKFVAQVKAVDAQVLKLMQRRTKLMDQNTSAARNEIGEIDKQLGALAKEREQAVKPLVKIKAGAEEALKFVKDQIEAIRNDPNMSLDLKLKLIDTLEPMREQLQTAVEIVTKSLPIDPLQDFYQNTINKLRDFQIEAGKATRDNQINIANRQAALFNSKTSPENISNQTALIQLDNIEQQLRIAEASLVAKREALVKLQMISNANQSEEKRKELEQLREEVRKEEVDLAQLRMNTAKQRAELRRLLIEAARQPQERFNTEANIFNLGEKVKVKSSMFTGNMDTSFGNLVTIREDLREVLQKQISNKETVSRINKLIKTEQVGAEEAKRTLLALQQELLGLQAQEFDLRTQFRDGSQQYQLDNLQRQQEHAKNILEIASTERQQLLQKEINAGRLLEEDARVEQLNLDRQKLEEDLKFEEERIQLLEKTRYKDPIRQQQHELVIQQSKIKTSQIILQLLQNEKNQSEATYNAVKKAIDRVTASIANRVAVAEQAYTKELHANNLLERSLNRQNELISAQKGLRSALNSYIDGYAAILKEGATDQEKNKIDREIAKVKLDSAYRQYEIEKKSTELAIQQLEIAQRRLEIENQRDINKNKNEQVAAALDYLAIKNKKGSTPEDIEKARLNFENKKIEGQSLADIGKEIEKNRKLNEELARYRRRTTDLEGFSNINKARLDLAMSGDEKGRKNRVKALINNEGYSLGNLRGVINANENLMSGQTEQKPNSRLSDSQYSQLSELLREKGVQGLSEYSRINEENYYRIKTPPKPEVTPQTKEAESLNTGIDKMIQLIEKKLNEPTKVTTNVPINNYITTNDGKKVGNDTVTVIREELYQLLRKTNER